MMLERKRQEKAGWGRLQRLAPTLLHLIPVGTALYLDCVNGQGTQRGFFFFGFSILSSDLSFHYCCLCNRDFVHLVNKGEYFQTLHVADQEID